MHYKSGTFTKVTFLFSSPADVASLSLGRPGPLCPAADLHEQICQLVWQHAPRPLPNETGPHFVQGPGVYTSQKIQRHRETLTEIPNNPFPRERRSFGSPHVGQEQGGGGGTLSKGASWSRRGGWWRRGCA